MSDLQELLVTLDSVNRDADCNASELVSQAQRLTKATAVVSGVIARGNTGPGATDAATSLTYAERAVTLAARQLHQVAVAGRGFIARHAEGSDGRAAKPGIPHGYTHPEYGASPEVVVADIPLEVAELANLEEFYGRDPHDDHVLDHEEYDARYTDPDGVARYPEPDGAVPGSHVDYYSAEEFIREHGSLVDRIGRPRGFYLGLRVDGEPATFDQRSLPASSLMAPYNSYELTGAWIAGWRLELSEVAPAFGRNGGGQQLLLFDADNRSVSIRVALREGILR